MSLKLIYRSYAGENMKERPAFYSKLLTILSFVRAAMQVPDSEIIFINDGPIPMDRLRIMQRFGRVLQIAGEPVGMRESYRFGLSMPDREGWADDDIVSFNEDDYLFTLDAFTALLAADKGLPQASYFTLGLNKPNYAIRRARKVYSLPKNWQPQSDRLVGVRSWFNAPSTASTFSARVADLRADIDIFILCLGPFRRRYLDQETCLLYQGQVPYHGLEFFFGLPGDFVLSPRGVARALFLVPYRFRLNARARRQRSPHYLYAPQPTLGVHMERKQMTVDQDWLRVAHEVLSWAAQNDLGAVAEKLLTSVGADTATG